MIEESLDRATNAAFNEQTKLLATAINNVAVAFVVIGFVTPVVAVSFGNAGALSLRVENAVFALVWLCAGFVLHWTARQILRGIRP